MFSLRFKEIHVFCLFDYEYHSNKIPIDTYRYNDKLYYNLNKEYEYLFGNSTLL